MKTQLKEKMLELLYAVYNVGGNAVPESPAGEDFARGAVKAMRRLVKLSTDGGEKRKGAIVAARLFIKAMSTANPEQWIGEQIVIHLSASSDDSLENELDELFTDSQENGAGDCVKQPTDPPGPYWSNWVSSWTSADDSDSTTHETAEALEDSLERQLGAAPSDVRSLEPGQERCIEIFAGRMYYGLADIQQGENLSTRKITGLPDAITDSWSISSYSGGGKMQLTMVEVRLTFNLDELLRMTSEAHKSDTRQYTSGPVTVTVLLSRKIKDN